MIASSLYFLKNERTGDDFDFMKCVRSILIFLLLPLFLAGCKKEAPKVIPLDQFTMEWSCSTNSIYIGEPVELKITTYAPSNSVISMPEIARGKEVVLLNRKWDSIPRTDGLVQTETQYTLTSFRLGDHTLSTNLIGCAWGDRNFSTNFPPIVLHVKTSLTNSSDTTISDIKPVQKLPSRIPRWLWVVLGSVLVAFLVGVLTSKWKKRPKKSTSPLSRPIAPHLKAFLALKALMNKGLLEQNLCNPFYTELSLILREYLEGRFKLNAPDETTEEIVEELSRSPELSKEQQIILQEFMHQADLVKFAKGSAERAAMEAAFETTKQFVEETKQD